MYTRADEGLTFLGTLKPNALKRYITRAEAMIDSYCGFDQRYGGFEPHTVWVQSKWNRITLRTYVPNWPVPIRGAKRYRIQVSMQGGNVPSSGFFAEIAVGDVAYNTTDNYVEIVPLQAIMYSLLPVIVELGLKPPIISMDVEMGYFLDQKAEILDDNGDHQTYYTQRGHWALSYTQNASIMPFTPPTVAYASATAPLNYTNPLPWVQNPGALPYIIYKNGVAQTAGFVADPVEGSVIFTSPILNTDTVTMDYTFTIPDAVREATLVQATYLLAMRDLARQGLRVADTIATDQQRLQRRSRGIIGMSPGDEPGLDPLAITLLQPYRQLAIA